MRVCIHVRPAQRKAAITADAADAETLAALALAVCAALRSETNASIFMNGTLRQHNMCVYSSTTHEHEHEYKHTHTYPCSYVALL